MESAARTNDGSDETQVNIFDELMLQFLQMCNDRHEAGANKYGAFKFLKADVIEEMLEELADLVNYARYQAVKLMILRAALANDPRLEQHMTDGEITLGVQSFTSSSGKGE